MELRPQTTRIQQASTHRLIPSRFPPVGIFDAVASAEDLTAIMELEGWTNDRLSAELGVLMIVPPHEWVTGFAHATAIMAAYCHPNPDGGRFNDNSRGAWYAAHDLETAVEETVYHRTQELAEIGEFETRVEMRQYLTDFDADFHDVRPSPAFDACHNPDSYADSQALGAKLLAAGSNGVVYRSVRKPGGECIACFRPPLILNIKPAAHFEYIWSGQPRPQVRELRAA